MLGKMGNAGIKPLAFGLQPQSSVYGSTIPVIYGITRQSLFLIWSQNLRQQGGGAKSSLLKKNQQPTYVQNVDFLLGTNPIPGVLQFWDNAGDKLDLLEQTYSTTASAGTITIPDANFYFITGVTATVPYSFSFNDYGSTGPSSGSGTYELPLWNTLYCGSDPTNQGAYRWYPWIYTWYPYSGATITIDGGSGGFLNGLAINIYYRAIDPNGGTFSRINSGTHVPVAAMRCQFEGHLGEGTEYSVPNDYTAQQIIYPHYAGLGSEDLDLGATQMIPNILCETVGAHSLYPEGDADFADMIEDIFQMGYTQAGFSSWSALSQIQTGLAQFNYPGPIQKYYLENGGGVSDIIYQLPNVAGNPLVFFVRYDSGSGLPTIADSAGNSWTRIQDTAPAVGGEYQGLFVATALSYSGGDIITITNAGSHTQMFALELGGVDTYDTSAVSTGSGGSPSGSITVTGTPGQPELIIAILNCQNATAALGVAASYGWNPLTVPVSAGPTGYMTAAWRIVMQPGTYSIQGLVATGAWTVTLAAWKQSQAGNFPATAGSILDPVTMQQTRNQCRANGLWGSLLMDSQQAASDWLADILMAANAAPVWSGDVLKVIPYSEASAVGNGAIYTSPTASGPLYNLTDKDFIGDSSSPMIQVVRKARVDTPTLKQLQTPNRGTDYNEVITSQIEQGSTYLYGVRKDNPKTLRCVQDVAVAIKLLRVMVNRDQYIRVTYKFKLQARFKLFEPMDLVTINDSQLGIANLPVRFTSIEEDDQRQLTCEAEPFIYGVNDPNPVTITAPTPYLPSVGQVPALVNPPIIFEATPDLDAGAGTPLWIVVSDVDPIYGGCEVFWSIDGGVSYQSIGTIVASAVTGLLMSDFPLANDPDTVNTLAVNLSESLGELDSYNTAARDSFQYLLYLSNGGVDVVTYELVAYENATLGSPYVYSITPTIRRGVDGAPGTGLGADHPVGSAQSITSISNLAGVFEITKASHGLVEQQQVYLASIVGTGGLDVYLNNKYWFVHVVDSSHFTLDGSAFVGAYTSGGTFKPVSRVAFLDPTGLGVLKVALPDSLVGTTIHFKCVGANLLGGGVQNMNNCIDYVYTPEGNGLPASPSWNLSANLTGDLRLAAAIPAYADYLGGNLTLLVDQENLRTIAQTFLNANLLITDTTLTVLSSDGFFVGSFINVGAEIMLITGPGTYGTQPSGLVWNVQRAVGGSSAGTGSIGDGVYLLSTLVLPLPAFAPGYTLSNPTGNLSTGPYFITHFQPGRIRILYAALQFFNDFGTSPLQESYIPGGEPGVGALPGLSVYSLGNPTTLAIDGPLTVGDDLADILTLQNPFAAGIIYVALQAGPNDVEFYQNAPQGQAVIGQLMISDVSDPSGFVAFGPTFTIPIGNLGSGVYMNAAWSGNLGGRQLYVAIQQVGTVSPGTTVTGMIQTIDLASLGTGFGPVTYFTVSGGGGDALVVGFANFLGQLTGVALVAPGHGYSVASNVPLTGGTGSGATINILTVGSITFGAGDPAPGANLTVYIYS